MQGKKFLINDGRINTTEIKKAVIAGKKANQGKVVILIDYAQLVEPPEGKYSNETEQLKKVSEELTSIAKDEEVVMFSIAHLGKTTQNKDMKIDASTYTKFKNNPSSEQNKKEWHHAVQTYAENHCSANHIYGSSQFFKDAYGTVSLISPKNIVPTDENAGKNQELYLQIGKNRMGSSETSLITLKWDAPYKTMREAPQPTDKPKDDGVGEMKEENIITGIDYKKREEAKWAWMRKEKQKREAKQRAIGKYWQE